MEPAADERPRWGRYGWVVLGAVLVGAVLRVAGMWDDFWLDEIWSWRIARGMGSVGDVLFSPEARVDNNHPLNTVLMYWMGDRWNWVVYRVPAVAAGIATVLLGAWYVGRRFGRVEGVVAGVLLAGAYPMVHYSSEARGYGLMVWFAVVGFVAVDRFVERRSWGWAGVFWGAVVLGFLSHLTFAHFYMAAVVWSVVRIRRAFAEETRPGKPAMAQLRVWDLAKLHGVPVAFALWLYVVFARGMTIGGAPDTSLAGMVGTAMSVMVGGPAAGMGRVVAAGVAGVLIVAALVVVWRRDRALAVFLAMCVVGSPAVFVGMQVVAMRGMETLFPRYFLVSMAFFYVMVAIAAGAVWGSRWRSVAVAVVVGLAGANLYQCGMFLRGTRGHYLEAVRHMAAGAPEGGMVRVGSDNAFRGGMLLGFYGRYVPGRQVVQVTSAAEGPAEWFVVNSPAAGERVPGEILVGGEPYRFEREFSYYGLSGWSWYVFRRAPSLSGQ